MSADVDVQLARYLEAAPSAEVLDELERRVFRGEAGVVRQAIELAPGVYTMVSRGRLVTLAKGLC